MAFRSTQDVSGRFLTTFTDLSRYSPQPDPGDGCHQVQDLSTRDYPRGDEEQVSITATPLVDLD
jgi:hypothetical protein